MFRLTSVVSTLLLISSSLCYQFSFKLSKQFDEGKNPEPDAVGSLLFTSKTESDLIPGWDVNASLVIACDELKTFQIKPSFEIHGGVVRTQRQISSYSGATSESTPVDLKNFIRLWNAGFGRSKNPVVGITIAYQAGFAEIKYEIANGDLIRKLESLKTPYEYKKEKYEIKGEKSNQQSQWASIFF